MFARVVLLKRLPRSLGIFDYQIPRTLKGSVNVGSLARVPFRGSETSGVVSAIRRTSAVPKSAVKPLLAVIRVEPYVRKEQLQLFAWIASYYHASPATIAKTFIPLPRRRRASGMRTRTVSLSPLEPPKLADRLRFYVPQLTASRRKWLIIYHFDRNILWLYLQMIKRIVQERKRALFLVPRLEQARALSATLSHKFRAEAVIMTGDLPQGALADAYERVRAGAPIVIGTQAAAIPPILKLDLVVLHDEESPLHARADQNPRIHLRRVAVELARLHQASLVLASRCPSAATSLAASFHRYRPLHLLPNRSLPPSLRIIDLQGEDGSNRRTLVSEQLQSVLAATMRKGKQMLLLSFHKGLASVTVCGDCGFLFACGQCDAPLRRSQTALHCPQGHGAQPVPTTCPHCRSVRLREQGVGGMQVASTLRERLPGLRVSELDEKADADHRTIRDADCVIAYAPGPWMTALPRLRASAVLFLDTLLTAPDYTAEERALQTLVTWQDRSWEAGAETLLCQTYLPSHRVLRAAASRHYREWYRAMLAERRQFAYPPFGHLIRLAVQRYDRSAAHREAERIHALLIRKLPPRASLTPPSVSRASSGRWVRVQMVLKSPVPPSHRAVDTLLETVPEDWIIEVDPESVR